MSESCYGCTHLRYRGPQSITNVRDMMGGTAIPLREQDGSLGPGEYRCGKLRDANRKPRMIGMADKRPTELEPGCKEAR